MDHVLINLTCSVPIHEAVVVHFQQQAAQGFAAAACLKRARLQQLEPDVVLAEKDLGYAVDV